MTPITDIFRLDQRRILVTGASSGLGRHFALTLARAGAELIVAARRQDRLAALVDEIAALGSQASAVTLDVTDPLSVEQAFVQIGPLDVLINNAGVTTTRPFLEQSEADWQQVMDTNLTGYWRVARQAARSMVDSDRGGCIVNIASILGERVAGGVAPYSVSKAGVIQLTRTLALELARYRIRANTLLPGYIVTELNSEFLQSPAGDRLKNRIPSRRFGSPEDLDGPLLLLASDASTHMSGAVIAVDGGHLVSSL